MASSLATENLRQRYAVLWAKTCATTYLWGAALVPARAWRDPFNRLRIAWSKRTDLSGSNGMSPVINPPAFEAK